MDTRCVLVRVERHDIGLLCSLMAGYEGGYGTDGRPRQGIVVLLVAPAFYTMVRTSYRPSQEMPVLETEDRPADSVRWCSGTGKTQRLT